MFGISEIHHYRHSSLCLFPIEKLHISPNFDQFKGKKKCCDWEAKWQFSSFMVENKDNYVCSKNGYICDLSNSTAYLTEDKTKQKYGVFSLLQMKNYHEKYYFCLQ